MAKLEDDLGWTLFVRSNRGLIPTQQADLLYHQIQNQKKLWSDFVVHTKGKEDTVSGLLRVGGHSSVLTQFSGLFADLYRQFPQLDFDFALDRSPQITRRVLNHDIDLGFVANPQSFDDLVIRLLKKEQVALFSAGKTPKKFITYSPDLLSSATLIKDLKLDPETRLISTRNYEFAALLAKSLGGAAILPESIAVRSGLKVPQSGALLKAELCLVYRVDRLINKKVLKAIR